jgi:hypothetical protein
MLVMMCPTDWTWQWPWDGGRDCFLLSSSLLASCKRFYLESVLNPLALSLVTRWKPGYPKTTSRSGSNHIIHT